jgi:UDP-glucose 4-epimerase
MTEGRQTREFTFVADMADALVRALVAPGINGAVINVGQDEEVSMRDLALTILDLLGNPVEPQFGALAYRPTEIWRMVGDSSRARSVLGWQPAHSLQQGLSETIDWYRARLAEHPSSIGH